MCNQPHTTLSSSPVTVPLTSCFLVYNTAEIHFTRKLSCVTVDAVFLQYLSNIGSQQIAFNGRKWFCPWGLLHRAAPVLQTSFSCSFTHSNLASFVSLCYDAVWYLSSRVSCTPKCSHNEAKGCQEKGKECGGWKDEILRKRWLKGKRGGWVGQRAKAAWLSK